MSRDTHSYDPLEIHEPRPSRVGRRGANQRRAARDEQEGARGGDDVDIAPAASRHAPLKPERLDTPRAFSDRDRIYSLRESELRSLGEIGTFRVVTPEDLAKYAYHGDSPRMERDLHRLKGASLVTDQTIEVSRKKTLRVLTLTKRGHQLLRRNNQVPDEQAIYHGLVKPKEAKHDATLYRLYQKEAARIERAGGKPVRVILDYQLKCNLKRDLAQLQDEHEDQNESERARIAERHGLAVVDGKIQLPDLRIEYQTAEMEPRHIDLDLVTRDYRPRAVSEKARAGFALYSPADEAPRLRRILNDRHLTAEILSL